MDREEAFRLFEEKLARERADRNSTLWENSKVSIDLINSPDDAEIFSAEYQAELRILKDAFVEADIEAVSKTMALDSLESFGGQVGEFVVPIAKFGIPALSGIIIGWIKARSGRTAKIEFFGDGGPKKIEASTPEEVISMIHAVKQEARRKPKKTS